MGRALEIISGFATNPSTTLTALTMSSNDSATVRSFPFGSNAYIENVWAQGATKGIVQVKSPRLHDNLQGIRSGYNAADPLSLWPAQAHQRLYPQDNLTLNISGGGSEVDVASFLVEYDDLPGVNARLRNWSQLAPLQVDIVQIQTQHTIGGTAGQYSGSVAINSFEDTLKANTDYAVLGYLVDNAVASVGLISPDFGNLRVGGPGTIQHIETRDWFQELDERLVGACIPVFNAANKGSTFANVLSTATSGTVNIYWMLAQLASIV